MDDNIGDQDDPMRKRKQHKEVLLFSFFFVQMRHKPSAAAWQSRADGAIAMIPARWSGVSG